MISVKNLTKHYGDVAAIKDISFEIKQGEIVGILGPNGAGKSTTLRMLTCYLNPSSGDAIIDGHSILQDTRAIKMNIGYLPESAPLYNDMVVFDYLIYMARVQGVSKEHINDRLDYVVSACSLSDVVHKNIGTLSKGYKQRVGLAGSIIHDPKILILDEPTNGLDPNQIVEIRSLIKMLGKEKTVLLSTHILSEVEASCSRVIIINKGNIVTDSLTSDLIMQNDGGMILKILVKTNLEDIEITKTIKDSNVVSEVSITDSDNGLKYLTIIAKKTNEDPREAIYLAIKKLDLVVYEMNRETEDLESVFQTLTKE